MSYQSLARKYRPKKFSDLVGQEAVSQALSNAITIGREPAAVLFSGVRGIGKTTAARLYAKALNCSHKNGSEVCDQCDSCLAVNGAYHEDVLEIDGASHNGVDEVRALKETVHYIPQRSQYKVYIIDEVHMLSISAFNALLKTLEEPPPQVVFIFATTELQKVPQTIIGRCQTFYLQKLGTQVIAKRIKEILEQEQIPFAEEALYAAAKEGRGSMRDALSFLDQAIAFGKGKLSKEGLSGLIGSISSEKMIQLLTALVARSGAQCIKIIDEFDQFGCDFKELTEELARLARHGFVLQGLGQETLELKFLGLSQHEKQSLVELGQKAQAFDLNRVFRTLIKCRQDLDGSDLDRFIFENYCLEWCFDPGFPVIAAALNNKNQVKQLAQRLGAEPDAQALKKPIGKPQFPSDLKRQECEVEKPKIEELGLLKASELGEKRKSIVFPNSWKDLIQQWKLKRPLEARKFEEAYLLSYSPEEIKIEVKGGSLVAKNLLDQEQQKLVSKSLELLFGFKGKLLVGIRSEEISEDQARESILDERTREQGSQKEEWIEQASSHPLTRELLEKMHGKLDKVEIKDQNL